jgi:hypothetical protein
MFECDLIKCQKAFHAVSDVPATQGCSADVFDVAIELKRRFAGLTDKLDAPFLISNLTTLGLAIVHDFNLLDRSISGETGRISDVFVFADDLIDYEPAAAAHEPDLLFVVQHAHAAGLLDSFALSRSEFHGRGRQRFARKNRTLRLIDCQVLNRKRGWGNQRGNRQGNESEFRFRHALKIKSDFQAHVIFLMFVTENVAVVRGELLVVLAEGLADWQLMKKTDAGPPALASVMNRRADKVR